MTQEIDLYILLKVQGLGKMVLYFHNFFFEKIHHAVPGDFWNKEKKYSLLKVMHLYFIKLWPRSYLCRLHRGQVCMWHQTFHHLVLWPLWSDIHYVDFQLLALPQSLPSVPLWQQWTSPLKKKKHMRKLQHLGIYFCCIVHVFYLQHFNL